MKKRNLEYEKKFRTYLFSFDYESHKEICKNINVFERIPTEIKNKLFDIMEYLNDEEQHFWENCDCSNEIKEKQSFDDCTCEENKNHIWRDRQKVAKWLRGITE